MQFLLNIKKSKCMIACDGVPVHIAGALYVQCIDFFLEGMAIMLGSEV